MPDVGKMKSVTQAPINVVSVTQQPVMSMQSVLQGGGGGGGTSNYNDLTNKPQIEGVTLSGNKTAADIGAIAAPVSPASGDFLVYNGSAWAAMALSTWQGGSY